MMSALPSHRRCFFSSVVPPTRARTREATSSPYCSFTHMYHTTKSRWEAEPDSMFTVMVASGLSASHWAASLRLL